MVEHIAAEDGGISRRKRNCTYAGDTESAEMDRDQVQVHRLD